MIRTYKRKLILTVAQEQRLSSWIGACRVVYNLGLEIRKDAYSKLGKSVHKYNLINQLTGLRSDIPWINDVPRGSLDLTIVRLDQSYNNFFKTFKSGGGFPKFARKSSYTSISFVQQVGADTNFVRIPKLGCLKTFKDEPIVGNVFRITIKKEQTGYFATVSCKDVQPRFTSKNQTIGLDMGITKFCTDSNGLMIDNPRHFKKYERQLRIENRSLARKVRGSNSWKKQCKRLGMLHHRISNVRKDFLHKESTKIAKANSIVYMEDLNIKGMVKSNLSKSISDAGWGRFRTMLEYKTRVLAIDPKYTSQACHKCKAIDKKSRLSQSQYVCIGCGHVSHADVNAAKNIKEKGILLDRQREAIACA